MSVRLRERGGGSGRVSAAPGKQPPQLSKDLRIKPSLVAKGGRLPSSTSQSHVTSIDSGKENRSQRNPSIPRQRPSVSDRPAALRLSTSSIPVRDKAAVHPSISRRTVKGAALESSKRKDSGIVSVIRREEKKTGGSQASIPARVSVDPERNRDLTEGRDRTALPHNKPFEAKDDAPDEVCSLAQSSHLVFHSAIDQTVPYSSSFSSAASSSTSTSTSTTSSSSTGNVTTETSTKSTSSSPSSSSATNVFPEVSNGVNHVFPTYDSASEEQQRDTTSAPNTAEIEIPAAKGEVSENIIAFENTHSSGREDPRVDCRSYPSRVHEKLALLEGRVRRIASDIERTKEMLDKNDGDATRKMLSDIQERICSIERDAGKAASGATGERESVPSGSHTRNDGPQQTEPKEDQGIEETVELQSQKIGVSKISVRIMNQEELEARFFPHQRLLKDRRVLERCGSQTEAPCEANDNTIGNLLNDEQHITSQFLASLDVHPPQSGASGSSNETSTLGRQRMGSEVSEAKNSGWDSEISHPVSSSGDTVLMSDEILDDLDDQENRSFVAPKEESDEPDPDLLFDIGYKPSTGGWFVSEGEAVLLAHDDGSCSYYDVINMEEKSEYSPPTDTPHSIWGDCWLIRAPGIDGCAGQYVVAASAGSTLASGFCSWDFYTKSIKATRFEQGSGCSSSSSDVRASSSFVRSVLAPLSLTGSRRRISTTSWTPSEAEQWWYRPCGCLILAASSRQSVVSAYDIRDGALAMAWGVGGPMGSMEFSSPLQWRNRGKVVTVGADNLVALWDVGSLNPRRLTSITTSGGGGGKIAALHVNNTEAELGGGVRQRVSSSALDGNDGAFCTRDTISVLDFRLPSGVGMKISNLTSTATHSLFSRGDSILVGSTAKGDATTSTASAASSVLQQFSLRMGKLQASFPLPDVGVHPSHSALVQVWSGSGLLMGVSGMGMFVFDGDENEAENRVGPDDLYCPSFDYLGGRLLVISKDRPAMWKYLR